MRRTPAMDRLAEIASDYDVVMIDNSSDGFAGNENDRSEVRAFVKGMLGGMAAKNNQAVLLLAHIDKQAARGGAWTQVKLAASIGSS
ncbi:AAA family ATPase [Pseudomonadales bacterium]|nr:AAA family ATPase [Pseudomonadales bacterium]